MPECPICIERKRVIATCPRCETQGCRDCMLRRAVENPLLPQCVGSCRGLSFGELKATIGPGLLSKVFRPAHKVALLAHEKQLIPSTMGAVEAVKRQEAAKIQHAELLGELEELDRLIRDMQGNRRMLEVKIAATKQIAEAASVHDIKTIVRCQKKGCLGCADHTGVCLVCSTHHCVDCGKQVDGPRHSTLTGVPLDDEDGAAPAPEHICDPNEVASLKEVAKSAKPCPNCGAPTTRVSGCPQMWCTYCRTGYRYDTLRINRGPVSNPERDDFMRSGGWTPRSGVGGMPCVNFERLNWRERDNARDALPRLHAVALHLVPELADLEARTHRMMDRDWWEGGHRVSTGVRRLAEDVTQANTKFRTRVRKSNRDLTTMRVSYIMGRLEEEEYSAALVRYDTRKRRDTEFMPVLEMYTGLLQDLDREWLHLMRQGHYIRQALSERTEKDGKSEHTTKTIGYVDEAVGMYKKLLWIQTLVQEGLDKGATALGLKRLGRLGEDGRLRLN